VRRDGATLLADVDLDLLPRQHLAVLGPNGAGKTTLLRVLATELYPTSGEVTVLGTTFGRGDLRELRPRIAFVSLALDRLLDARLPALPLVAAARLGATWPPPGLLERPGLRRLPRPRSPGSVPATSPTDGSTRSARGSGSGSGSPGRWPSSRRLCCWTSPSPGWISGARVAAPDLDRLLAEPDGPTVALVTHHLEELPVGIRASRCCGTAAWCTTARWPRS
jgi:iron complex transport system ATP-binding protein